VITNVVGLAAAILGDKLYWWIDPVGAIILAIYTITNWGGTVLENAGNLRNFTSSPIGQASPKKLPLFFLNGSVTSW
jgi:divalent metal cation (Fe/Co/Zn/Cd) transporter